MKVRPRIFSGRGEKTLRFGPNILFESPSLMGGTPTKRDSHKLPYRSRARPKCGIMPNLFGSSTMDGHGNSSKID